MPNMDKSHRYFNKPGSTEYMLYGSIYMKSKQDNDNFIQKGLQRTMTRDTGYFLE